MKASIPLVATTYSANRGYAWSNIPECIPLQKLNDICRIISSLRGDFPDPMSIDVGIVSDGSLAAAFTLQNVAKWDSAGRDSDYFALAFFPVQLARRIDFVSLISTDFFWTPSKTPSSTVNYEGPSATSYPTDIATTLLSSCQATLTDPHAIGSVLSDFGPKSNQWVCQLCEGTRFKIKCNPWCDTASDVKKQLLRFSL